MIDSSIPLFVIGNPFKKNMVVVAKGIDCAEMSCTITPHSDGTSFLIKCDGSASQSIANNDNPDHSGHKWYNMVSKDEETPYWEDARDTAGVSLGGIEDNLFPEGLSSLKSQQDLRPLQAHPHIVPTHEVPQRLLGRLQAHPHIVPTHEVPPQLLGQLQAPPQPLGQLQAPPQLLGQLLQNLGYFQGRVPMGIPGPNVSFGTIVM